MPVMRTTDRPRLLGRFGEREAKTPTRVLPSSFGGRTVGLQEAAPVSCFAEANPSEKCQISQMCV